MNLEDFSANALYINIFVRFRILAHLNCIADEDGELCLLVNTTSVLLHL